MRALKFRVLLDSEKNQEVFRDILIDENENFETFYRTILAAFNFEGKEMGSFYMSNEDWDKGYEIGLMDMSFSDEEEDLPGVMSQSILKDQIEFSDQKMILVYDFLRMWIFLIELQEIIEKEVKKPEVLMSMGIAPPEDSKMIQEEAFEQGDFDDEDGDEFGEDYEDGYNDEDFGGYEEYEY